MEWGLSAVVAASWAETEHWECVSAGESQHALMICHFIVHALLMHVLLGRDVITGWLMATVYHFALVSGH